MQVGGVSRGTLDSSAATLGGDRSLRRVNPLGQIVPIYAPTTADGKPITSDISIRERCMNASPAFSTGVRGGTSRMPHLSDPPAAAASGADA
ncbi:hypothetical protein GCM10010168_04340 [Actinoplanes ianthinogenes]|uniref:Uncharacterized protein n=1 Tax=Actinoplanes ianthinogenes TaxID=122358 RepID=A0ABN6CB79_9ACTN|nr:hypothetical protein Aiant_34830 [Actinoplanes ianthinogenes]GGQ91954.1 hypothetical protein GCM10010168_04340 [Actinoplanes ianthinogenes]